MQLPTYWDCVPNPERTILDLFQPAPTSTLNGVLSSVYRATWLSFGYPDGHPRRRAFEAQWQQFYETVVIDETEIEFAVIGAFPWVQLALCRASFGCFGGVRDCPQAPFMP
jgi:hypothetical protein